MGLFDILDKLGGAGVKAKPQPELVGDGNPGPMQPVGNYATRKTEKQKLINKKLVEKQLAKNPDDEGWKTIKRSYDLLDEISSGRECDVCHQNKSDYLVNDYEQEVVCKDCHWKKTQQILNSEPDSLYDEGYNDGAASMSPVYTEDNDYMMGYYDGVGDDVREVDVAIEDTEPAMVAALPSREDSFSCDHGQHQWKPYSFGDTQDTNMIKCVGCGVIKYSSR